MMKNDRHLTLKRSFCCLAITAILLFVINISIFGQEPPPRPLVINVTPQGLSFGAFTLGITGGTVVMNSDGSRVATGDVILLNMGYTFSTALLELIANPGTVISLLGWPSTTLTCGCGGTMSLQIDSTDPVAPFVMNTTPPAATSLNIGGKLTVGTLASNPAGNYSGTFNITFIQE